MQTNSVLCSRKDAARLLGISVRLLDLLVSRGKLRPCRLGSRVLIRRREIEDFAKRIERASAERTGQYRRGHEKGHAYKAHADD